MAFDDLVSDDRADAPRVERLVGVYHADGGLRGELTYVALRLLGRAHCSLCDVTHGSVRRTKAFDALRERLSVPFELVHRNERDAGVTAASGGDTPCVLASVEARPGYLTLLGPVDLERAGGDVRRFEELLLVAAAAHGLSLGAGRARADQ